MKYEKYVIIGLSILPGLALLVLLLHLIGLAGHALKGVIG